MSDMGCLCVCVVAVHSGIPVDAVAVQQHGLLHRQSQLLTQPGKPWTTVLYTHRRAATTPAVTVTLTDTLSCIQNMSKTILRERIMCSRHVTLQRVNLLPTWLSTSMQVIMSVSPGILTHDPTNQLGCAL